MEIIGIYNIKDGAELLSYIVTIASLLYIAIGYFLSKKQIHFSVITKCIEDYRNFIKKDHSSIDARAIEYIDIVNEEFFYLEKRYLPIEVVIEWVDGIIDYLPFYANNKFYKSKNLESLNSLEKTNTLLYDYPRILKAIDIKEEINFDIIFLKTFNEGLRRKRKEERDKLIYHIILNLQKKNKIEKRHLKKRISQR